MKSTSEGESGVTTADVREENDAEDSLMVPALSTCHITCGEYYISLNNFLFAFGSVRDMNMEQLSEVVFYQKNILLRR